MPDARKKRIAIVGGGCAAMAAAWDLTAPENRAACDVTIFQMGGRLGGKAASSRNPAFGDRIEEHGLHLWLGYYENAFRMVRTCFKELQALEPADRELKKHLATRPFDNWNWLSAFERASLVGLADESSGDWIPWIARFPEYVPRSENGVTGIYEWSNGTTRSGVHLVDDERRAYPGEEPIVEHGSDCDDGEDVCLERPNVAFFLTHALRELRAFVDSLESRVAELETEGKGLPSEDPDELLSRALNLRPARHQDDAGGASSDIVRTIRLTRLALLVPAIQALATIAAMSEGPVPYARDRVIALLDRYIDSMREKIETIVTTDVAARRIWELIDLIAANIRGLVVAGLAGKDDFSSLDEWNYEDWLRMNRISERTLRNPIVRGAHDLGFAYERGDPRNPQIAAGQAINAGCHFFFMYKGSLFWRMKAGMGDVVFAPMYLALRSRGVKFRFFHRLDDIELDEAGRSVTGLKFWRQAKLRITDREAPTNYEPLAPGGRTHLPGWRTEPDVRQFAHDRITAAKYERAAKGDDPETYLNFESIWCNWEHGDNVFAVVGDAAKRPCHDQACVGEYDEVIVTVPVAALERVSKNLAAAPNDAGRAWDDMLRNIGTVATQSMQLWLRSDTRELGWMHGQVSFSGFVHPFDTWADLSHLTKVERQDDTRGVHYFCSVLPEEDVPVIRGDPRHAAAQLADVKATVKENARRFLNEWVFQLWPDAVHRYPNVFKWELLVDPRPRPDSARPPGTERLDAQHLVANVDPSERYTQSLPGTTKFRIRPDGTGFRHLFVAGDWTDCGLNFGCVEAAVISGRLAASGISGYPDTRLIPNYVTPAVRMATKGGG